MSLNDNHDIFPVLRTKNIVLNEKKISIQFLLSTRDSTATPSWLGPSRFKDYVKVYFLLVPESKLSELGRLPNPQTRFRATEDLANMKQDYIYSEVSFSEIINSDYASSVSEVDLYSETVVNDLYYEIDLDIKDVDYETEDKWYLFGFIHLDVILAREFQLEGFLGLGGNFTSDILLTRNDNNLLLVPPTVEALYLPAPRGSAYFGPAHYHGHDSPGPDGYIGWMAGYKDGEMGSRLDTRNERYTKVVAKNFIDDTGFMSGFFGGEPYAFEVLDGDPNSTGTDLELYARQIGAVKNKILGFSESVEIRRNARKRAALYYSKLNQSNILISAATHLISVNRALPSSEHHHGVPFTIEYGDLLALHSSLGWLFEYHVSAKAPNANVLRSFASRTSQKQMIISRKRLTNGPDGNTKSGASDYLIHDIEKEVKDILFASDNDLTNSLNSGVSAIPNDLSNIHEMYISSRLEDQDKKFFRSFYLQDYDLFRNIHFGNYTYQIQLYLTDGIKKTIMERFKFFKSAMVDFLKYMQYASIPYTPPQSLSRSSRFEQLAVQQPGSFDYARNTYTESFRNIATEKYSKIVQNIVDSFISCYEIVDRDFVEQPTRERGSSETTAVAGQSLLKRELIDFISPSALKPGSLDLFFDMCRELENTYNNLMITGKIKLYDDQEKLASAFINKNTNHSDNLSRSPSHISNDLIYVSADIPVVATALTGAEILYEPFGSSEYEQRSPPILTSRPQNTVTPTEYFVINNDSTSGTASTTTIISSDGRASEYSSILGAVSGIMNDQADRDNTLQPTVSFTSEALVNYTATLAGIGNATISFGHPGFLGALRSANAVPQLPTSEREKTELTKEIEEAICAAALKETNREEFIENTSNTYKQLVLGIDLLGNLWDDVQLLVNDFSYLESNGLADWRMIANNPDILPIAANFRAQDILNIFEDRQVQIGELRPGSTDPLPANGPVLETDASLIVCQSIFATPSTGILVNNIFYTQAAAMNNQINGIGVSPGSLQNTPRASSPNRGGYR